MTELFYWLTLVCIGLLGIVLAIIILKLVKSKNGEDGNDGESDGEPVGPKATEECTLEGKLNPADPAAIIKEVVAGNGTASVKHRMACGHGGEEIFEFTYTPVETVTNSSTQNLTLEEIQKAMKEALENQPAIQASISQENLNAAVTEALKSVKAPKVSVDKAVITAALSEELGKLSLSQLTEKGIEEVFRKVLNSTGFKA